MAETILEFKNLSYKYPGTKNWVLRDVNLKIPQNSFYVLTGPTGCGKTTLLMLARGFSKEYGGSLKGEIFVEEENIKNRNISELGSKIGIIFQNPALQLHQLRVIDEVMSAPMYQGLPYGECKKKAENLIKEILGEEFYNKSPNEISSGQQQKVALSSVLVMEGDILLLDEPFSFLDEKADKEVMNIILKLKEKGKTIVIATHDLEQVSRFADKIILMKEGRLVLEDSPREVLYDKKLEEILTAPLPVKIAKKRGLEGVIDWQKLVKNFKLKKKTETPHKKPSVSRGKEKSILGLRNISFDYPEGITGIKNVNLDIYQGEILGIIGANGSGKTTLAKVILGLLTPSKGEIKLRNKNITKIDTSQRAKSIGYVTQDPMEMFFEISVLNECMFGPKCLGLSNPEKRAKETLRKLDLLKYKDKHPDSLSGGEKSKLAIADILVNNPEILLLDEPEFGLDLKSWQSVAQTLKNLSKEGKTIIVITQDLGITLFLCDRIAIMKQGQIKKTGTPKEIYSDFKLLKDCGLRPLPVFNLLNKISTEDLTDENKFINAF